MVILISGPSCTGKTYLAKTLLENHKITFYSIDHIKMGLFRGQANCGFTPLDPDEDIAEILWPIVKGIIMTAIENSQDLIMEGAYLFPEHLNDFTEEYSKHIIPVFIGFSENYIRDNFESGILKFRQVAEVRDYEEDRPIEFFIEQHLKLIEKCRLLGMKCFIINENYELEMSTVIEYVREAVEKRS